MNERPAVKSAELKPYGFMLRSLSQKNFPWLNTRDLSDSHRSCGNMRKYIGDGQVWKTRHGASSYVSTNPTSGISNLEVVPIYSDPRKTGEKSLNP